MFILYIWHVKIQNAIAQTVQMIFVLVVDTECLLVIQKKPIVAVKANKF